MNAAAEAAAMPFDVAIDAARRGDSAAWDALFDRFHPVVLRYAAARLGDRDAAQDIAQDVFVAAVQAVGRLRDVSERGVESWLLRIARNKVADRIRRLRRERRQPITPDPVADAAEVALARLSTLEIRSALNQLSDDQRDLILRRFVLDQTLNDVAAATGRRVGAVKSMQRRALASLLRLCEGDRR